MDSVCFNRRAGHGKPSRRLSNIIESVCLNVVNVYIYSIHIHVLDTHIMIVKLYIYMYTNICWYPMLSPSTPPCLVHPSPCLCPFQRPPFRAWSLALRSTLWSRRFTGACRFRWRNWWRFAALDVWVYGGTVNWYSWGELSLNSLLWCRWLIEIGDVHDD